MKIFSKTSTILRLFCIVSIINLLWSCAGPKPPRYPGLPPTQQPYVVGGRIYYPLPTSVGYSKVGYASWYGRNFHGRPTSSGEMYNMYAYTAAHKTLPLGTYCLVENLENGKKTIVRINDRGPFVKNRIIDLSYTAAKAIGLVGPGVAKVRVTALGEGTKSRVGRPPHFKHIPDLKHGNFYIQVGAFKNKQNAIRLKKRLSRQYARVIILKRWSHHGLLYGVQIFGGTSLNQAKRLEYKLEKSGFPQAFIVSN
ncbi:Rare lipoprotein A precursor [Dissulfuribacter thermophilus]|uniref:Probable endolytic peptidoglycan transglycosylase RlpA n=1 Tax=Dissulfuribacter thermophilus TaxID=1156395 RepID=A0A1B9F8V1_9BACT|nr:septal ring lytic transglycosylase RlpA family protein [Dissulfuribacter thermophilus]OCC16340.1 Rare lipoprotein A precursor [Dissulfuribacter thermophilus]